MNRSQTVCSYKSIENTHAGLISLFPCFPLSCGGLLSPWNKSSRQRLFSPENWHARPPSGTVFRTTVLPATKPLREDFSKEGAAILVPFSDFVRKQILEENTLVADGGGWFVTRGLNALRNLLKGLRV